MLRRPDKVSPRAKGRQVSAAAHLRAEIERLGLNQGQVARNLRVSRQTISNIVNGRTPISRAMAGKLGRLTARAPDYWLRSSFSVESEIQPELLQIPWFPAPDTRIEQDRPPIKSREGESFRSFVRRLSRAGIDGALVRAINDSKGFPEIESWGQLRTVVRKIENSDAIFVAARQLWRHYNAV